MKKLSRPVLRQRPNGRWEAKTYAGMKDGKSHYVYCSADTQAEAADLAYAKQRERQPARTLKQSATTVAEWSVEFLKMHAHSLRRTTQVTYQSLLTKHILPKLGEMKLRDVEPIDIQLMEQELLVTGLSPNYIRTMHVLIGLMFARAFKLKIIPTNPCADVDPPSLKPTRRGVLSVADVWTLFDAFKGTWWHNHIFVLMHTGLRRGELLGLRVCDVNIDNATISVVQSVVECGSNIWIQGPKTKSAVRQISVPPEVLDVLKARIALFSQHGSEALLFPNQHGQPQRPSTLSRIISKKAKKCGLHAWTHILRHSHASALLQMTGDLAQVSHRLGHSNPVITARVYTHAMAKVDHSLAVASAAAFRRPEEN